MGVIGNSDQIRKGVVMSQFADMIGKEVLLFVANNRGIDLFLTGDTTVRIHNGYYAWRIVKDGEIVITSADMFMLCSSENMIDFLPFEYEESFLLDEENAELIFEQLETYTDRKSETAKGLLEGSRITAFEVNEMHDVTIKFSKGIVFNIYLLSNITPNNKHQNSYILQQIDGKREKRIIYL